MELGSALFMAAALAAGALVKGATGMGLPLIALPALTAVFGLQHAVVVMLLPQLVTNLWQLWLCRVEARSPRLAFLPLFLVAAAIGCVIGSFLLTTLPERALVMALGLILLAYVGLKLFNPHISLSLQAASRFGPLAGLGAGLLQGATGISAPIGVTFIHAMALGREAMVFAVSAMFMVISLVQLPTLWAMGGIDPAWLLQGLLALVPILLFMPLGQMLAGKFSRTAFDRAILIFLGLIGLKMVLGF